MEPVDRVGSRAAHVAKRPPASVADRVDDREADHVLEPLQPAEDDRPVRPGARQGDVEVVAAGGGGQVAGVVGGDPATKHAVGADPPSFACKPSRIRNTWI